MSSVADSAPRGAARSMASRMARRFLEHRLALASLAILVVLGLASLAAPLVELAQARAEVAPVDHRLQHPACM